MEQLALAFEQKVIKVPDDAVLIAELQSFESSVLPASGKTRYSAQDGAHDDTVIALCLAWEARMRCRGLYPTAIKLSEEREMGRQLWQKILSGGW